MRTAFYLTPGESAEGKQLGSLSHYLLADNPTGQWWFEKTATQYIPPYTMNMRIDFDVATQSANLFPQTPPGAFSMPLPGQVAFFSYFDASVTRPRTNAGGGGQNPAGAPDPGNPIQPANEGSSYRGPVDIAPLPPGGPTNQGYAQTEGTDRVPAPLSRVAGPMAGTPLTYRPGLPDTHAMIEGLTILPHDEQGRVMYGDSFERANPEKLWSATNATLAGSADWAMSGSKSGLVTQSGTDDGVASRRFPIPRFGGNVGVEVLMNGAFSPAAPDGAYLQVFVRNGRAEQVFGVRFDSNQPSYFDALSGLWLPFDFPVYNGGVLNNIGDVLDLTALKVVFQNREDGLAYSHVVINGYVFNLWDIDEVVNTGAHTPASIDVVLGVVGDSKAMVFDDVKITSNEAGNTPTSRTLGIAD